MSTCRLYLVIGAGLGLGLGLGLGVELGLGLGLGLGLDVVPRIHCRGRARCDLVALEVRVVRGVDVVAREGQVHALRVGRCPRRRSTV